MRCDTLRPFPAKRGSFHSGYLSPFVLLIALIALKAYANSLDPDQTARSLPGC